MRREARGDRVLLYMQNSPQFVLAYYAILRANAVVVPVNPMNLTDELRHYVSDSRRPHRLRRAGPVAAVQPLLREGLARSRRACRHLRHAVVATYSDYLKRPTDLRVPDLRQRRAQPLAEPGVMPGPTRWPPACARPA
jgi:fatty-acyl-CoA synthase